MEAEAAQVKILLLSATEAEVVREVIKHQLAHLVDRQELRKVRFLLLPEPHTQLLLVAAVQAVIIALILILQAAAILLLL